MGEGAVPLIRTLLDRRVPQYVGLYVAAGWGFVQFVDWAVERYVLSSDLTNLVIVLLLSLLPSVVAIAWRFGAPGDDHWKRRDGFVVGLNALLAAVIMFGLFRDVELRASTTIKLLEDAEGNTVERVVPTAAARRDILVFDFENETGDPDLDWMEHGLTSAIGLDLLQDIFVNVEALYHRPVQERAAEAGFGLGDDIPVALMQDIAGARGMEYFFDGTIERAPEGGASAASGGDAPPLLVRTRLYDTRSGRVVATHDYPMTGPLDGADPISLDLRRDAGIPEAHLEESPDLPVAELSSRSAEAFRAIAEARARMGREGDPIGAMELARRAVTLDSTAAIAQNILAWTASQAGDRATMRTAVGAALTYNYRLPEPMRLATEVRASAVEGDTAAMIRTARYWTERYPQDLWGRHALAEAYQWAGDDEGSIGALRGVLAVDPTDVRAMQSLAYALFSAREMADSAIAYLERAIELRPDDVDLRLDMARLAAAAGRPGRAREVIEGAAAIAPRDPDVSRQLALVDLREGDIDRAFQGLDEVKSLERTPTEVERRVGLEETLYYVTGQFGRLEDAYDRRLALLASSRSPSEVATAMDDSEYLWYAAEAGRGSEALARIDSLKATVEPPWNLELDYPAARIHLDEGNLEGARESLAGLEQLAATGGQRSWLQARIAWVEGRIAELEDGDCGRALASYDRARELQRSARYVHATRLRCLTALHRWDEAQEEDDWLVEQWPGWTTSRFAVARYHAARGRTDEAVAHLDAVLRAWANADADYRPAAEARAMHERLAAP